MSESKLNQEIISALQNCKTKEEAEKFAKENQLTDEELEKVTGGESEHCCSFVYGTKIYVTPVED